MENLDALVHRCVSKVPNIGSTAVLKLIYLADLEARKYYGEPISPLNWKWYDHGPFDSQIYQSFGRLAKDGFVRQEAVPFSPAKIKNSLKVTNPDHPGSISSRANDILDGVIARFGSMNLDDLLKYVYDTPPMKQAQSDGARNQFLKMELVDNEFERTYGIKFSRIEEGFEQISRGEFVEF